MTREQLRKYFRPRRVKVLFIGESPPHSRGFFYRGDSALFRHTVAAFDRAFGWECKTGNEFLIRFKRAGCYLEDLCHTPINHLRGGARKEMRKSAIRGLATRIKDLRPSRVVVIMIGIRREVAKATQLAEYSGEMPGLPFPGHHHQPRFERELTRLLRKCDL